VSNAEREVERGSGVEIKMDCQRGSSWPSEVVRTANKKTTGTVE